MARPESRLLHMADAMQQVRAEAARCDDDILISSEGLPGAKVPKFANELVSALDGLVGEVILAIVVREHFERAASVYNQGVKDPFSCEKREPDDFLRLQARALTYRPLATRLKATGLRLVAVNYHGTSDLAARFVAELGGDPARLPPPARRNMSIAPKGLISVLELNRLRAGADRVVYFNALRRMRGFFSGGAFPFTASAAHDVRAIFDSDAEFVARELGVELPRCNFDERAAGLAITEDEFTEIERALSAAGIVDPDLLIAIKSYVRSNSAMH
jgi:hypothetical protein